MNENWNEKCCLLVFVARFGFLVSVLICYLLPSAALRCSFLFYRISFNSKKANVFGCLIWLFVACFGFRRCFHLNIALLVLVFFVRKAKTSNKRQKMSKWRPGLISKIKIANGFVINYFNINKLCYSIHSSLD